MSGKKRSRRRSTPTPAPESSGAGDELDLARDHEVDPELFEMELETTAVATASPPGGGDPDAHDALVAALSGETTDFALSVFEATSEGRRAAVALAILDAFGPDEGATLVAEAYDRIGEALPDLSDRSSIMATDLDLLDDIAEPEPGALSPVLEASMQAWRPALARVTDPVAFMDDESYAEAATKGGKAKNGFFALATTELQRLLTEMDALSLDIRVTPKESRELARAVDLVSWWSHLYETIRDTGDQPSKRDELTDRALSVVDGVQTRLDALDVFVMGLDVLSHLDASLDETRTFVLSWASIAANSSRGKMSMSHAFVKTNQRYRQILNNYDMLEERGGAPAKHKTAIRNDQGTVTTRGGLEQEAEDAGGMMGLAMEALSYDARDNAKALKQLDSFVPRIFDEQFGSLQEVQEAARQHVYGGAAMESFYRSLDNMVGSVWHYVEALRKKRNSKTLAGDATSAYLTAQDENDIAFEEGRKMTFAEIRHRAEAENGYREQSQEYWETYEQKRKLAENAHERAAQMIEQGDAKRAEAIASYREALAHYESARRMMGEVDTERWPILKGQMSSLGDKLDALHDELKKHEGTLEDLDALRDQVTGVHDKHAAFGEAYQPEQQEVEIPPAFQGLDIDVSTYARVGLSLSARIPKTPIKIEGKVTSEFAIDQTKGERWGRMQSDWSLGLSINLLLIKLHGSFVGGNMLTVRDALTPAAVLERGEEERSRYYAKLRIAEKKPDIRLRSLLVSTDASMDQTFGALKEDAKDYQKGGVTKEAWGGQTVKHALNARKAQANLRSEIMMIFLSLGKMSNGVIAALGLASEDQLGNDILALRDVKREEATEAVDATRDEVERSNHKGLEAPVREIESITDYTRDQNVKFRDYVGYEWGVEVGTSNYSGGYKSQTVWAHESGEGEEFDFREKKVRTDTATVTVGKYSGEIAIQWINEKPETLSITGSIEAGALTEEDREAICGAAKNFDAVVEDLLANGIGGKALLSQLSTGFKAKMNEPLKALLNKPRTESLVGSSTVMIGYERPFRTGKGTLRLGQGHKKTKGVDFGVFEVEGFIEVGQEVAIHL